jgi:hypothetical protein
MPLLLSTLSAVRDVSELKRPPRGSFMHFRSQFGEAFPFLRGYVLIAKPTDCTATLPITGDVILFDILIY